MGRKQAAGGRRQRQEQEKEFHAKAQRGKGAKKNPQITQNDWKVLDR